MVAGKVESKIISQDVDEVRKGSGAWESTNERVELKQNQQKPGSEQDGIDGGSRAREHVEN